MTPAYISAIAMAFIASLYASNEHSFAEVVFWFTSLTDRCSRIALQYQSWSEYSRAFYLGALGPALDFTPCALQADRLVQQHQVVMLKPTWRSSTRYFFVVDWKIFKAWRGDKHQSFKAIATATPLSHKRLVSTVVRLFLFLNGTWRDTEGLQYVHQYGRQSGDYKKRYSDCIQGNDTVDIYSYI